MQNINKVCACPVCGMDADGSWCVCRPDATDAALQRTLDYACGHGADCAAVLPTGPCYSPTSVRAHCSYAANSYFQRNSQANGATCDFGGTAMLITKDPSKPSPYVFSVAETNNAHCTNVAEFSNSFFSSGHVI